MPPTCGSTLCSWLSRVCRTSRWKFWKPSRCSRSEGLKSTGGLSNNSNGAPKTLRPIMDSALVAMAMMQGLTSAIVNPCDLRLMETIKSCDIFKNHVLYSDSYLDL